MDKGTQAFRRAWNEDRRGEIIEPRLDVPPGLGAELPVGFKAQSTKHFRLFNSSAASREREGKENFLCESDTCITKVENALAYLTSEL